MAIRADEPLVRFLYLLARDEVPIGILNKLVGDAQCKRGLPTLLSDEHLARWAKGRADALAESDVIDG